MKPCLDENELMRLWAAEPDEFPDQRTHLAQCAQCTASYDQLARDASTITSALTTAADHLRWRDRAVERTTYARIGDGLRMAAIFSGAAAFGGAAAFALLVALGWHPASASTRLASAGANTSVADTAAAHPTGPANRAIADAGLGTSYLANGSLYTVDALTSDPLAGLAYGDSVQAGNSNAAEDLLFCVPDDDSAMCSSSAEQG
jgi:hypothetical protein